MRAPECILFEPVGCLAEFPPEPFLEIAARVFGRKRKVSASASRAFWHLLNLMEVAGEELDDAARDVVETLELQAVAGASLYEDVVPSLSEVSAMGVKVCVASSLSGVALNRFLQQNSLETFFSGRWDRDSSRGIKTAPLKAALLGASLNPESSMYLTDTLEGLRTAQSLSLNSILMMNDPDEARRLAMHNPSAGIVSLHELPDFIRLLAAQNPPRVDT
jgi:phosphoglycolate phosphatase-like HAD superfamily hydrolase